MNPFLTFKQLFTSVNVTLLQILTSNVSRKLNKPGTNQDHLKACMDWLCRAQDLSGCEGCSATYRLFGGWTLAYPETTGYIISTFLRYAKFSGDENFIDRAKKMGDWEINIQLPSGAVRGSLMNSQHPVVFNTGMVILGWTDLYDHTGEKRYLSAAVKAAEWLCDVMDNEGKWVKFEFHEVPHAYCSRVAWSLLEVYRHTKNEKYKDFAIKNVKWVLSVTNENGWINNMSFYGNGENPLTHTIAYTLRGLLECSMYLDGELRDKTRNIVIHASEKIMEIYQTNPSFPHKGIHLLTSRINDWKKQSDSSCLTGNAQMAIIWLKIFQLNKDNRFYNSACELISEQKKVHSLDHDNPGIRGGIAGSYPIWGDYCHFSYLNWAVKFYADAIMLAESEYPGLKS